MDNKDSNYGLQGRKLFLISGTNRGADREAGVNKPEGPSVAPGTENRTADDLASEMDNPGRTDGGVRIREYAITPGRVLRTLEKVVAAKEAGAHLFVVS
jgi:hypothetical protein